MSPAPDADPSDDPPGSTRGTTEQATHPSGEIDATVVSTTAGDVPILELPTLDDDIYLLDPDAQSERNRRGAVLGSLHALALDTALAAGKEPA